MATKTQIRIVAVIAAIFCVWQIITSSRMLFSSSSLSPIPSCTPAPPPVTETPFFIAPVTDRPEPLRCKHSPSLDASPAMIKEYGPPAATDNNNNEATTGGASNVGRSGWCELVSSPSSSAVPNEKEPWTQQYRSAFEDERAANKNRNNNNNKSDADALHYGGSTFVSYKEFSDEDGSWPYYQCPVKHRIRCGDITSSQKKKKNKKKTKALVIYAVTAGSDIYQHHFEADNYDFFLQHGLIPANTPTALFDAVDFVMIKVQIANETRSSETIDCGTAAEAMKHHHHHHMMKTDDDRHGRTRNDDDEPNFSNVRFMMAPKVPCDLCADLYVLDKIGLFNLTREQELIAQSKRKASSSYRAHGSGDDGKEPQAEELPYGYPHPSAVNDYVLEELARGSSRQDTIFGDKRVDAARDSLKNNEEYSYVVLMNSGVRGPFFNSADDDDDDRDHEVDAVRKGENIGGSSIEAARGHPKTTWIDFMAMAGRRRIPNPRLGFFDKKSRRRHDSASYTSGKKKPRPTAAAEDDDDEFDCPTHVSTSTTISWEVGLHHQSFFVGMPIEMFRKRMYPLFASACPRKSQTAAAAATTHEGKLKQKVLAKLHKLKCIFEVEIKTGTAILNYSSPFAMYSLNRQFYVQDVYEDSFKKEALNTGLLKSNPTAHWVNPCSSMFSKIGGEMLKKRIIQPKLLNAVDKLTKGMTSQVRTRQQDALRKGFDFLSINRMFEEKECEWSL